MAKVTFDGPNKLIIVDSGITELDVKLDLYSDWKEWVLEDSNSSFLPAFSVIGGDPTGPGTYSGTTFFVMNGWKIRPHEADHTLIISGNIIGDGGAEILVPTEGGYTVAVQYVFSSLGKGISTSGSSGPTVSDIVNGMMAAAMASYVSTGTFGKMINDTRTSTADIETVVDNILIMVDEALKYDKNRTRINKAAKTLTVYDDDGTTPLRVFNLLDGTSTPSVTEVLERMPA